MIPTTFDYHKANTIDEAIGLLKEHGADAKLLAGGHSLLPSMKLRLSAPEKLIDITRISELKYIREEGEVIAIGAGATHHDILSSSLIKDKMPMMAQAGELIGDVQVRNMGTIGGSLAHADPAADWPASLLAAEAEIVLQGAGGKRTMPMADFFLGLFMTALQEDEIITEIRVPVPPANTGTAYLKFMQPASRFAIVGCAAMVTVNSGVCEQVRVGFTGVGDIAFRDTKVESALQGKAPDENNIATAANEAAEGDIDILSDHFASEAYRKHLAKVYAKRALLQAIDTAT